MKTTMIQNDFGTGEVSPRLLARTDLTAYDSAVKTMENAYPLVHGGATRRPGTQFIGEVRDSSRSVRVIEHVYSNTRSYILVLNDGFIQFLRNGEFLTITAGRYELAHPYADDELDGIKFAQAGSTLFLVHPNHPPRIIQREPNETWWLTQLDFTYRATTDYWYENAYIRFKILGGGEKFVPGDEFTIVVEPFGGGVNGYTSGPKVGGNTGTGELSEIFLTSAAPAEIWTLTCVTSDKDGLGEWTVTGSVSGSPCSTWRPGDYPSSVSFFQQRLYFAGSASQPKTIWGSELGNYQTFTRGAKDTSGFEGTIDSNRYEKIIHLEAARQLLPFSYGGEFSVVGGTSGITPSSVRMQPQTSHGASDVKPVRIGQEVLFTQRDGKTIRSISYSVTEDANVAPNINILAEHITKPGIVDMSFSQAPDYIMWLVRKDGVLLSMTRQTDQNLTAWARHPTSGFFESLATVPEELSDATYCVVRRTINGYTKRYIERIDYVSGAQTDSCAYSFKVEASTVWSGFIHLEGQVVDIVADGRVHPQRTVNAGTVVLQYPAHFVEIGLPYRTKIELLSPEPTNSGEGTSQGKAVSVSEVILRMQDTVGCFVNDVEIPFRNVNDLLDTVIPPFTGDKKVGTYGWRSPQNIVIEQRLPKPWNLLGVILHLTINS